MILQALYYYYERSKDKMPPMKMAHVTYSYAIIIDAEGTFKGLEALGEKEGTTLLTFRPEERTSAPVAHCMGDNGSYVLGLKDLKPGKDIDLRLDSFPPLSTSV